ncbi:MAG: mitochondrial fission ELM1 family protein, partial [Thioalkalivibrio sp.]|nr:mitochondrial fission ELM1 family protein [Thioalkalivibrio sp.]
PAYLGASDVAFCTQDSLTMLTDAMASARPVFALTPQRVVFDPGGDGMFERYLSLHETGKRIRRVPITALGSVDPISLRGFLPLHESIKSQIYQEYVRDVLPTDH